MSDRDLPQDRGKRAAWVAESRGDIRQTRARFDAWATHYDADVAGRIGWQPPLEAAKAAQRYIPQNARILDAGCGTGLVGEAFAAHGYSNIIAADLSPRMLQVAREKDVYRGLCAIDLTKPLAFSDGSLDALVSIGTSAWIAGETYIEFARVVRPSGTIICAIGDARFRDGGFEEVTRKLAARGCLESTEEGPGFCAFPDSDMLDEVRLRVFRVLA